MNAAVQTLPAEQAGPVVDHHRGQALVLTTPADLLRIVVEQNAPLDKIEKMMDLQERWEKNVARKAFNEAMANFRAEHVVVRRSAEITQGPMKGLAYAKLADFVDAAAPAMAKFGLSASWRIVESSKDWIKVACVIRHVAGHEEEVSFDGPPDQSGAKNPIQSRASTVTYLEKYTLKMALGLAEQEDDDDGNGGPDHAGAAPQTQQRQNTPPPAAEGNAPPSKPPYSDEDFDKNLPAWRDLVTSCERTPAQIIARLQQKATLTDQQRKEIHALSNPQEHAHA